MLYWQFSWILQKFSQKACIFFIYSIEYQIADGINLKKILYWQFSWILPKHKKKFLKLGAYEAPGQQKTIEKGPTI